MQPLRQGCSDGYNSRRLFADWLKWAGVNVPTDENGYPPQPIEISPLFALDKKELAAKIKGAQLDFTRPLLLE